MSTPQRVELATKLVLDQISSLEWLQALAAELHTVHNGENLRAVESVSSDDCGSCWAVASQAIAQMKLRAAQR